MGFGLLASKVLRPTSRLLHSSQNPTIFLRTIVSKPQLCNPQASAAQREQPPRTPDELSIEEEAERKVGWLLKTIFFVTAGVAGYHFFPYMGDNLMQQSISLLRVKDPLFKRMGASRLTRFAVDDERRKKIIEMGGAQELLNMLSTAKDDRTRKAALQALDALLHSDEALASMHQVGAVSVIRSVPNSLEDAEVEGFKLSLMKRFQDLRYDVSS
ncbi:uncharacterized protein LOC114177031 [Vigna unguiculata]|uniref:NADH dehydrogenase n=1 Tax=Vigna unguiculata TaxID=3917 RepID=A0A4D6MAU1_VIGUN|nr:uncharacterized protein LOC114177031 [Vigna unguiculata]QCD98455.1 NADH dehydrogenase [Vigna unguiculata]